MTHYHITATLKGTKKFESDFTCDITAEVWADTKEQARREVLDYDYTGDPRCPYDIVFHEPCILSVIPLEDEDGDPEIEVFYGRDYSLEDLFLDPDAIYERRVLG